MIARTHILLVEDNRHTKEIVSRTLLRRGYQVTVANEMESGLEIARDGHFALVVADIFMKGMGGIEGIKVLRERFPEIKILAISAGYSGMSPDDALKAAGKIGADTVLAKPFEPDDLAATVVELLGEEEAEDTEGGGEAAAPEEEKTGA